MLDVQELDFEDCFYGGETQIKTTMYSDYFDIREMPLMQYTGLHDKNGKEIYEGDIVEFSDTGEEGYEYKEGYDFENRAKVIYFEGQYCLDNFFESDNSYYAIDGQDEILEEILRNGNCEVIGNIYEDKNLLNT